MNESTPDPQAAARRATAFLYAWDERHTRRDQVIAQVKPGSPDMLTSDDLRAVLAERHVMSDALAVVRMLAEEATTDDADLLRQAILDQLPPGNAHSDAEAPAGAPEGPGKATPGNGPQRGASDVGVFERLTGAPGACTDCGLPETNCACG